MNKKDFRYHMVGMIIEWFVMLIPRLIVGAVVAFFMAGFTIVLAIGGFDFILSVWRGFWWFAMDDDTAEPLRQTWLKSRGPL